MTTKEWSLISSNLNHQLLKQWHQILNTLFKKRIPIPTSFLINAMMEKVKQGAEREVAMRIGDTKISLHLKLTVIPQQESIHSIHRHKL